MAAADKAVMLGINEADALTRDGTARCGCGEGHKMLPFCDRIARYRGKLWVWECLTDHLVTERERLTKTVQGMHRQIKGLKDAVASSPCILCDRPAGRSAKVGPGGATCITCQFDIGGG